MRVPARTRWVGLTLTLALASASCSASPPRPTVPPAPPSPAAVETAGSPISTAPTAIGGPISGALTVFAAASLTAAFDAAATTLKKAQPLFHVAYNFGGSNALASQIVQGAPADVFASADTKNMQKLVDAGLVGSPVTFAKNKLEIAVRAGNPLGITGLVDLAKPGTSVVLAAAGVPAGDYTRQVMSAKHLSVTPKSLETDVKSSLAKITSGEADATVVYVTDVAAAGSSVSGVAVPDADQPAISYPMAVVRGTKNPAGAQAFVDSARSGAVQKALEAAGFLPPQ